MTQRVAETAVDTNEEAFMAAEQTGADVVVIKRPVEHEGKCIKEVIEYLEKL